MFMKILQVSSRLKNHGTPWDNFGTLRMKKPVLTENNYTSQNIDINELSRNTL